MMWLMRVMGYDIRIRLLRVKQIVWLDTWQTEIGRPKTLWATEVNDDWICGRRRSYDAWRTEIGKQIV